MDIDAPYDLAADEWIEVRRTERVQAALSRVGFIVMCFGGMIISGAFALVSMIGLVTNLLFPTPGSLVVVPVCTAAVIVSGWHVAASIMAMIRPQLPAPVQVALMQPAWPTGMRWIVAGWWMLHLSFGALLAISAVMEEAADWTFVLFLAVVSTAFTYAAHGFLLLVVTCYTKHADWVLRVWGWRHVCSIGHGVAVLSAGAIRWLEG